MRIPRSNPEIKMTPKDPNIGDTNVKLEVTGNGKNYDNQWSCSKSVTTCYGYMLTSMTLVSL